MLWGNMIKFFSKLVICQDNTYFVFIMIMIKKIEQLCRKWFSGISHGRGHISMLEHVWGGVCKGQWEHDLNWWLLKVEGHWTLNKGWNICEKIKLVLVNFHILYLNFKNYEYNYYNSTYYYFLFVKQFVFELFILVNTF